ncbi:MAG: hypothetical protein ACRDDJ_21800, partial [[Mycobacterium] stephanolepidis]
TAVSRTLASVNQSERFTGIVRELPSVIECFLFYFFVIGMRFGGFLGLDGNGYCLARLQSFSDHILKHLRLAGRCAYLSGPG